MVKKAEVEKYDIKKCLEEMKEATVELEEAKGVHKEACTLAYAKMTKEIVIGDPDPPTQKALTQLAKAMAEDKVNAFSSQLRDLSNALLQGTGETPTLFDV